MLEKFGLGRKVEEKKSLKNKDFLIFFCNTNISSLYFVCITSTIVATTDVIAFIIDCLTIRFISVVKKL